MKRTEFKEKLTRGLKRIGIKEDDEKLESLWKYMLFLIRENKKYNLTAIDQADEIITKHFLDSLILLKEIDLKQGEKLIDVGTGAGFPGLVLKIFSPGLNLVLLDSLNKRIKFLELLIESLDLSEIEAIHARAEDLARDINYRENFDWVVSRAVAPLNILSEYTLPFARKGGKLVFYKGPDYKEELKEGEKAISILGGSITGIKEVKVPNFNGKRYLVFIKKLKSTPFKYPRRVGIPKKRPL